MMETLSKTNHNQAEIDSSALSRMTSSWKEGFCIKSQVASFFSKRVSMLCTAMMKGKRINEKLPGTEREQHCFGINSKSKRTNHKMSWYRCIA